MNQEAPSQRPPETYGYTTELQKKIAAMLLYDPQILPLACEVIRPEYFDHPTLQDLVAIMLRYMGKYARTMPQDVLLQEVADYLGKRPRLPSSEYYDMVESILVLGVESDFEYVRDRVLEFAKYQAVKQALWESTDLLQKKRDYPGIQQRITKAAAVGSKPEEDDEELHAICVADVDEREVDWLLPNRVAYDELTIWGGNPGGGKSYLSMWLAAHVTTGAQWEMEPGGPACGSVIILNTEDSVETSIRRRLRTNGADLKKCHVIDSVLRKDKTGERLFSLTRDLNRLGKKMEEIGDVRLVVIDLMDTYLGTGIDSSSPTDISAVIAPLKRFAEQHHIAIVGIMHLNKNEQSSFLFRLLGSIKFGGIPRVVEYITRDKKDPRTRYFHIVKLNHDIWEDWENLDFAFHRERDGRIVIDPDEDIPPIETQIGPETKEEIREKRKKTDEAVAVLRELLERDSAPEAVQVSEVKSAHPEIYNKAWLRAREEIGMRKPFQKDGVWWWGLKKKCF